MTYKEALEKRKKIWFEIQALNKIDSLNLTNTKFKDCMELYNEKTKLWQQYHIYNCYLKSRNCKGEPNETKKEIQKATR